MKHKQFLYSFVFLMFLPLFFANLAVGVAALTESAQNTDKLAKHSANAPAVQWHRGLGTNNEEHVHEGMQTGDGGYIAIGETNEGAEESGPKDILVIKTDANGQEQWQRVIGTAGQHDIGYSVTEATDGYILGVGLFADGKQQRGLIKLDHNGQTVWQKPYGGNGNGGVRSLIVLNNGELVATGYTNNEDAGFVFIAYGQGFLMKTDADGNVLWDHVLQLPQGTKVRQESNGGLAVLSTIELEATGVQNVSITRTDSEGQVVATYTYGENHNIQAFDFDLTTDGGFIFGGHTTGYGTVNWDFALTRVAADGTALWTRTFGQPRGYDARYIHDEAYGVRQMLDGGFLIVGGTGDEYAQYSVNNHASGSSDEWKAYVVRTDGDGNTLYEAVYGDGADAGNNAAEFVALTQDGGYILFNDTDSQGQMIPSNFGFMKIAPEHTPLSILPSPVIVERPSSQVNSLGLAALGLLALAAGVYGMAVKLR